MTWKINGLPAEQFFEQNPKLAPDYKPLMLYSYNSTTFSIWNNRYEKIIQNNTLTEQQKKQLVKQLFFKIYYEQFEETKKRYQTIHPLCLNDKLGVTYNHTKHSVNQIPCLKFDCDRCRKNYLIPKLKNNIEKQIETKKLHYHIVITTEGKNYREHHTIDQSYKDIMYVWNIIRKDHSRKLKKQNRKLSYILLNRAQKNGYSHLHILLNHPLTNKQLQNLHKKYPNIGKQYSITKHKNTASYLTNDFAKDHEWYIPLTQRHYTTSRDIDISNIDEPNQDETIHIMLNPTISKTEQIYDQIDHNYHYPPPLPFLLQQFYDNPTSLLSRISLETRPDRSIAKTQIHFSSDVKRTIRISHGKRVSVNPEGDKQLSPMNKECKNENRNTMDRKYKCPTHQKNKGRLLQTNNCSKSRKHNTSDNIIRKTSRQLSTTTTTKSRKNYLNKNKVTISQSVVDWM